MKMLIRFFSLVTLLVAVTLPASTYVYWTCDGQTLRWKIDPVRIHPSSLSFPVSHPYTNALGTAISSWNLNPSTLSFLLMLPGVSGVNFDNGRNETWFSDDAALVEGARAVTFPYFDCSSGAIVEADVVFNVTDNWTSSTYKYGLMLYGGAHVPFDGVAIHEFGHVLGLDHEDRVYNIMLGWAHTHTNGNAAPAYPGEDASNGAVFLYGLDSPSRQDVAVSHWKIIQLPDYGTIGMFRTVVFDHEPQSWNEFVETVDGFVAWRDLESEPRFMVHNGQRIWPEFTFENNGADLQQNVTADYYLSADDGITTADRLFASRSLTLGRDIPFTRALPVTLPNDLPEGSDHTLGVLLDRLDNIAEPMNELNATYLHIRIMPTHPLSLTFNPSAVQGGNSTTGTVTLIGSAPAGGVTIQLSSSDTYITYPATVSIPAGQMTATFTVNTANVPLPSHRVDMTARRAGVAGDADGSFVILGPRLKPELPFCAANAGSIACNLCQGMPDLDICNIVFSVDEFFPPMPPWPERFPFGFTGKRLINLPDNFLGLNRLLMDILMTDKFESVPPGKLEQMRREFEKIPAGFYFDEGEKRALVSALSESKALTPELLNTLAIAVNAIHMDAGEFMPSPHTLAPGPYVSADFDGAGWVGFKDVKKPVQVALRLREGLPATPDHFKPIWPVASYAFSVSGSAHEYEFADLSFSVVGLVPSVLRSRLRLYEWNGVTFKDITTSVDSERATISGRTDRLRSYVIGRPIELGTEESKKK